MASTDPATVRGYGLESFLTGDQPLPPQMICVQGSDEMELNSNFLTWHRQDQLLSAWIQSSLTESTLIWVVGLTTTKEIWRALETSFANQSKAKIMQYKLQLQTLKKESLTMRDYLNKEKTCCDLLGSAGCRVLEEDQILHILSGLGTEYDPVMVTITSKADAWTVQDVSALLLSFESRLETIKQPTVNVDGSQPTVNLTQAANQRKDGNFQHNKSGYNNGNKNEGGRGSGGFRGGRGGRGGRNYGNRITCQVCQKVGHGADRCWHHFEQNYTPQNPQMSSNNPTTPINSLSLLQLHLLILPKLGEITRIILHHPCIPLRSTTLIALQLRGTRILAHLTMFLMIWAI